MAANSRPISDVDVTGWTSFPTPGSVFAALDDESDVDYAFTDIAGASPATMVIDPALPPGNHKVVIRAFSNLAGAGVAVVLRAADNSVLGTSPYASLSTSFATYEIIVPCSGTAVRASLVVSLQDRALGLDGAVIGLDSQTIGFTL